MTRLPFDSRKSAGVRRARREEDAGLLPLSAEEERAAIEAAALAGEILAEEEMLEGGSAARPWSVRQVNALVNQTLAEMLPGMFFIQGEISNFRVYDRGHAFFTLKEAGAELPCVFWKDGLARLKFRPKDGMAVIARGAVKLYEPQGKLQLYVETLLPQGSGALEVAFRQLCEKLRAEGLFETARKRAIPRLPRRVVIVTSRTGDVLHDVLTTAYRRFPGLHTMLYAVRVQGEQAAAEIARAIEMVNLHAARLEVDLILLVRGGGSLEDLWAFNEEIVARAIIASRIPIATGIGHEPDTTIADLVGDLRGPTPTGVAELTIPEVGGILLALQGQAHLMTRDVRRMLQQGQSEVARGAVSVRAAVREAVRRRRQRVDVLAGQVARIEPRHAIAQGWRRVEEAQRRLADAMLRRARGQADALKRAEHRLEAGSPALRIVRHRDRVAGLEAQLRIVSPQAVLERGFSITMDAGGAVVRSAAAVKKGDVLTTRVADGEIISTAGKPKQATLF